MTRKWPRTLPARDLMCLQALPPALVRAVPPAASVAPAVRAPRAAAGLPDRLAAAALRSRPARPAPVRAPVALDRRAVLAQAAAVARPVALGHRVARVPLAQRVAAAL